MVTILRRRDRPPENERRAPKSFWDSCRLWSVGLCGKVKRIAVCHSKPKQDSSPSTRIKLIALERPARVSHLLIVVLRPQTKEGLS
jgi:hypothetical protein